MKKKLNLQLLLILLLILNDPLHSIGNIFKEKSGPVTPDDLNESLKSSTSIVNPEVFQTTQFEILTQQYVSKDSKINWSFQDTLKRIQLPAGAFFKYKPENSIKGVIRFYNNQLWLGVFDNQRTKLLLFFIDDGIDGYIYEGKKVNAYLGKEIGEGGKGDGVIDRIAVMSPKNGVIQFLTFDDTKNPIEFKLPDGKFIKFSQEDYRSYFSLTYLRLQNEKGIEFTPFDPNNPLSPEFKIYEPQANDGEISN